MQWRQKKKAAKKVKAKRPPAPPSTPDPKPARKVKLSRQHKPPNLSLEQWQIELRRQFGREQNYELKNLGDQPVFSEFEVTNPQSRRTYRVQVRGPRPGDNVCSCPDFATNTLGTCKHIEFTLASLEKVPAGVETLNAGLQPPYSEVYLHYGTRREVRFRPGTSCPVEMARLAANYFGADSVLLPDAFAHFDAFLSDAGKLDHELRCQDDVMAFVAEMRDAEQRRQRVAEAFPRGPRSAAFKTLVNAELYNYQREGVLFAARAGRCLIGDDMGLGKTLQAIATSEVMAKLFGVGRVLIVCPTSLKHQWQREIEKFVGRSVQVINGFRTRREKGFATDTFFKILNYDVVYRDLDLIRAWSPDLVILDEAQRIKNWNTRTARSVKQIPSPYALVLTGTPLENRLEELISIVQFVDMYRLGPTYKLLAEHQVLDEHGKVVGYQNLDRLGQTLEPILVRRKKDEVLDQLPERIDSNVFVPMTAKQIDLHDENKELMARIVEKWRRLRFLSEADKQRLMIALQRMRMACDNSYLVDHVTDHGPKADEIATLLEEELEQPGAKVVVFSQWLRMHELLVKKIKERGWGHVLFHGGVASSKRGALIDRFRDDPKCRVFLSTDAGGTGLNLQHASVVINVDLPWNPAVLEQRIGRVHRLGQKRTVRVVNFVSQGTIEEGMLSVLKFKKSLFAGVLDGGEKEVFLGGTRLNRFMQQVEAATSAIPEGLLEDAEEAYRSPDEAEDGVKSAAALRPKAGKRGGRPTGRGKPKTSAPVPAGRGEVVSEANPWSGLLTAGVALLQQLAGGGNGSAPTPGSARVMRDEQTGETYLKVPVPSPEVVEQALKAVGTLLESLRR